MHLSPSLISHHAKSLALNVKVGKEDNIWLDKNVLLATYLRVVFSWLFLSPNVHSFWAPCWVVSTRKTEEGKGSFTQLKKLYIFSNNNSLPVFLLICTKIVHNQSLGLIFTWHKKKWDIQTIFQRKFHFKLDVSQSTYLYTPENIWDIQLQNTIAIISSKIVSRKTGKSFKE